MQKLYSLSRDTSTFVTKYLRNKLSIPTAAGVVVKRGSEYILAHTGLRQLDGHPLGGCGSGFGLIPGYTTLSVRVRANMYLVT